MDKEYDKLRESVASQIDSLMKQKGLNQTNLADAMGKPRATVVRMLDNPNNSPRLTTLYNFAKALNVEVEIKFKEKK